MNRALTFVAATVVASLAVSGASFGATAPHINFTLGPRTLPDHVQLRMTTRFGGDKSSNWSQGVPIGELVGLSSSQFRSPAPNLVRFALIRGAGRFDCSGTAHAASGRGTCAFAPNAAFSAMLARRGVGRPSPEQSYRLAMGDFRPAVLDALAAAGYPRPTLEESVSLGIFDIEPAYVRDLAAAGYRLGSVEDLVSFKIHKVDPQLIRAYAALGYRGLKADDLMAMAIHRVTPEFITSFARLGYRNLPADKLVELRIFGVTPDDVRALQADGIAPPSADQLVRLRRAGIGPRRPRSQ